ncbi:MAG: hypothetical protein Kow00108_17480 [Calditrichia bacterium]
MNDKGTFQIFFELTDNFNQAIGALGFFVLPAGFYVYTGRSNQNLLKRIDRLVSDKKTIRFHLDYLSIHPFFKPKRILIYENFFDPCLINEVTAKLTGGHPFVPGFGIQSDDRCYSHLLFLTSVDDDMLRKLIRTFQGKEYNLK